ncbi:MAG: ORF6N domain-containing protein [Elusimicrobiota bacterium]
MEDKKIIEIENKIIEVREQKVILDTDVAKLYDVETKEINQAVTNNPDKFPEDYIFELTKDEKTEVVKIFDHLSKIKFSPHLPKAFTEKGLYMLATISFRQKDKRQFWCKLIERFNYRFALRSLRILYD